MWEFSKTQSEYVGKPVMPVTESGELKAPRGQALKTCFPEFASNAKRSGVLGNTNEQGMLSFLTFVTFLSELPLILKVMM